MSGQVNQLRALVFDVETADFPDMPTGWTFFDFRQIQFYNRARLVEVAWALTDVNLEPLKSVRYLVRPDGTFQISEGAASKHGITAERAAAEGVPLQTVLDAFLADLDGVQITIAHNHGFDFNCTGAEAVRAGRNDVVDALASKQAYCTMAYGGRGMSYTPSLSTLYTFATGLEMQNAHSAAHDVANTLEALRMLVHQGVLANPLAA